MIAYINDKGRVLAVFKSETGRYSVYIRYRAGEGFKGFACIKNNSFDTRFDAEAAMYLYQKSHDKSWKKCEKWSG